MPQTKEQKAAYAKEYYIKNKEVLAAKNKEYREKNKEKVYAKNKEAYRKQNREKERQQQADYKRQKKYGISPEEYNYMIKKQNNKCKICLVDFLYDKHSTKPFIDHCHTTNKVRGLLCLHCNTGLGYFKDQISTLTKTINYLEENK
jgi:1-aminocyclopropane-1-carboxylate deaminase/D-cysteine desulfhydrase-like pyridoxal-dependent ACC family enzyme